MEYSAKLSEKVTELKTQLRSKESEIRIQQSQAEINLFQAKLQQKANEELEVKIVALQADKVQALDQMNNTKVEFQAEREMHVKTYKELEVVRAKLEQQRVDFTDEHRREVQQFQASVAALTLEKSKVEQEFRDLTKQFTIKLTEDQ